MKHLVRVICFAITLICLTFTVQALDVSNTAKAIEFAEDSMVFEENVPEEIKVRVGKYYALELDLYGEIKCSSANKKIATVTKEGRIKGIRKGTTYITVSASGDEFHDPAEYSIKVIVPTVITKAVLKKAKLPYSGDAVVPEIKTINGSKKLVLGTDYTLTCSDDLVEPGKYQVIINGIGKYDGQVTKTFDIVKASPGLSAEIDRIDRGEIANINAVYPEECPARFQSSNENVLSVDPVSGEMTGLSPGSAYVTITTEETDHYLKSSFKRKVTVNAVLYKEDAAFTGHRGFSSEAPENTMPSFLLAEQAGFEVIEFDIWESKTNKDDQPFMVIMHDSDLGRMCGKPGVKSWEVNRENIDKCVINNGSNVKDYPGLTIPDYEEALESIFAAGAIPTIEFKSSSKYKVSDEAIQYVLDTVGERRANIISFSWDTAVRAAGMKNSDNVKIGFLMSNSKNYASIFKKCKNANIDYVDMNKKCVTSKVVKAANAQGLYVNVYAMPNDKNEAYKYIEMGVSGITSNYKLFK